MARHDAEDCAQTAIIRAAVSPDLDLSRAEGYLSTIAVRLTVDQHRERASSQRRAVRFAASEPSAAPPVDETTCDNAEAVWFDQQLPRLRPRERQVIQALRDGATLDEAARDLNISYKAAHSALSRARGTLTRLWRATLAVTPLACFRPRGTAAGAMKAAALITVLGTTFVMGSGASAPGPARAQGPERSTTSSPTLGSVLRSAQSAAVGKASPGAPLTAREQQAPQPVPVTLTPGLGNRRAAGTGPVTEYSRHPEESFLQTVERCVTQGVVVSVTYQGCRG